jgi:hypothetical protein
LTWMVTTRSEGYEGMVVVVVVVGSTKAVSASDVTHLADSLLDHHHVPPVLPG